MPMGIGPGLSVTRFESGIPGWMTGMDLGWDFTQNVQYSGATNPTDTHSATVYAQSAAGGWSPFAANTMVQTDLGLQTVPTRTEILTRSVFAGTPGATNRPTGWATTGANSSALTLLSSENVAGFSTLVMQIRRVGGGLEGIEQQSISTTAVQHEVSVFIRRPAGVTGSDAFFFENANIYLIASAATINAQPSGVWVRYGITPTLTGSSTFLSFASGNGGAGTGFDFAMPSVKVGAFVTPPIPTTGTSATVNGNQQVVDLTGRLGSGVGVIFQWTQLAPSYTPATFPRAFEFNDGTANNTLLITDSGGAQMQSGGAAGGVTQPTVTSVETNTWASGVHTVALAASNNYLMWREVGRAAPTALSSFAYPSTTRLVLGGRAFDTTRNNYGLSVRLAIRFGAQDATTFADLFAKATILAAVS